MGKNLRGLAAAGEVRATLERAIPFRFLSAEERESLLLALQRKTFDPGATIADQHEESDDVYILVDGSGAPLAPSGEGWM